MLLNKTIIKEIDNLPSNVFDDPYVDCTLLFTQLAIPQKQHRAVVRDVSRKIAGIDIKFEDSETASVEQFWWANSDIGIVISQLAITFSSLKNVVPLEKIAKSALGLQIAADKNLASKMIERYVSDTKRGSTWFPFLQNGSELGRYEIHWEGLYIHWGNWLHRQRTRELFETEKLVFHRLKNRSIEQRITGIVDDEGFFVTDNFTVTLPNVPEYSLHFLLAVLQSTLLNKWYRAHFDNVNILPSNLHQIPVREVYFTTSTIERAKRLAVLISQYEQGQDLALLSAVETLLPKYATGAEEKSDIVHDLLAHLAQQMIDLNKQKQAEQKRFLDWLENTLSPSPSPKGREGPGGFDALTGKTKILGYLGDYQKDEPETSWPEIEEVLFKNRGRLGVSLNDPRLLARLRGEYEKSLETLRPLKAQLARTDRLIDQVVYRLYGLTEEEIAVVEGRGG